ncbi:hypothetical protein H6F67_23245 [Microcoleus sp. FACHB-1515]|uniref:hypothetical protein n=1 Tax=Cyanophyceae TaxID=3028117 RepID=UPI001686321A|nr:hypothetical protein [Microcoleus sp. FACHB-1515]MBD2092772.1 hypothetical protein [Microcoleus sp. FACHB-1515]
MKSAVNFQPLQILCLEHDRLRLYVEVIQVAEPRQMCWVRPLMLAEADGSSNFGLTLRHDLRQCADLLWPIDAFRAAIDTEVLPLLAQLKEAAQPEAVWAARQQLQILMQQVWQANQA